MKITKFMHSCLLVEMPAPTSRTVLFDPGAFSEAVLDVGSLEYLDDIIITHGHPDHYSPMLMDELVRKFPDVRITAPPEVVRKLTDQGITLAASQQSKGIKFFSSPHESVVPLFWQPEQIGVHYLDTLTVPGDSHSFAETKDILALPVTGPWGSVVKAVNLAIEFKPKFVLPIHDWHWNEAARKQMYKAIEAPLKEQGIEFIALTTGKPVVINT
jgi:L-ascorbate metabolism protein UlaG (beta-lactamase superfamily)